MDWEPFRADHAIDRVAATIFFLKELDADTQDDLAVAARKAAHAEGLTERLVEQSITLPPNGTVVQLQVNRGEIGPTRIGFKRSTNEGRLVDEVLIGSKHISIRTRQYRRWDNFFHLISNLIRPMADACPPVSDVQAIRLEYLDRFLAVSDQADHFQVLLADSKYLVPAVAEKTSDLHVHSGWFDNLESETIRRLTNVNVDVLTRPVATAAGHRRRITILTLGRVECLNGPLDHPIERFKPLHSHLNATFRGIISPDAAARVGLKG